MQDSDGLCTRQVIADDRIEYLDSIFIYVRRQSSWPVFIKAWPDCQYPALQDRQAIIHHGVLPLHLHDVKVDLPELLHYAVRQIRPDISVADAAFLADGRWVVDVS